MVVDKRTKARSRRRIGFRRSRNGMAERGGSRGGGRGHRGNNVGSPPNGKRYIGERGSTIRLDAKQF